MGAGAYIIRAERHVKMGRGKKDKPADSSAAEPNKPPPVAPRPGAKDAAFEQEKASKTAVKQDGEDLSVQCCTPLSPRLTTSAPTAVRCAAKKPKKGGIKGLDGKPVQKGERRLANRLERERKGKAFLEVCGCSLTPSRLESRAVRSG